MLSLRGMTEHETFDHPVAMLIAISSANPDPMGAIMQLYNPNVPSFTVDKPYVDTNILRYYVLIHDPQQTTLEQSQEIFDKMKKSFGLHCHMLTLDSRPQTTFEGTDALPTINTNLSGESIRTFWQNDLEGKSIIDNSLQHYTQQLSNNNDGQPIQPPPPPSPSPSPFNTGSPSPSSPSIPPLSRSNSSSSIATNTSLSAPAFAGVTTQTFDMDIMPLDQPMSSDETNPIISDSAPIHSTDDSIETSASSSLVEYGQYWTVEHIDKTKIMVKELVTQSLIPFMERNIQHWNEQVASGRRGLTGRLFGASRRLFGTNHSRNPSAQSIQTIPAHGKNVPSGTNSLIIYPYGAPEAQMRKLADFAFMLRDYKFAQVIYDTARRDYATDKAYKYHAGTQEMIGICFLMMNQPLANKVDVDRNFELAVQQYIGRCRSPFHATRTTVIYYELLKSRRMWKEIPTALVRMTGEDSDLRSALFLEQAAHCFLRSSHPMVRKYSFHLVMAGHRYVKASQRMLALRCYKLASIVLNDDQWSVAKSHVQFALGRQSFHLGHLEDAVNYFANVLPDAKQTPSQQIAHIREFLFIYQQYATQMGIDPRKETLPDLRIPTIDDKSIRVSLSNTQRNTDNQDEWATMERELLETNIEKGYILKSKKALALQQQDDNRVICAVGEPTTVRLELCNPLQVAVTLSEIILGCQYRTSIQANQESFDTDQFADEGMIEGTPILDSSGMFDFGDFALQKISQVTLDPLEHHFVILTIIPRKEGSITITGLHFTFNDLVHTFRPFHKKGKRLNNTKEERMNVTYAPDRSLDILVTPPMPLLDITFHNIPETILSGQVIQGVLEINNKGNKGLTSLQLKTNQPSFICVGHPEQVDKPIYDCGSTHENKDFKNQIFDPSVISIPLPSEGDQQNTVQPGKTTLVPLWVRGDRIGKHTLKFLFSYQSEEENSAIAQRTLRYTLHVQVTPSLKINAFTRPSMTATNEFILGVEIENLLPVASFDLRQLTAASALWSITPLSIDLDSEQDISDKTSIPPRQTTFVYFKIRKTHTNPPLSPLTSPEDWTSHALAKLLANDDTYDPPPPIDLAVTNLSFRKSVIPYNTVPLRNFALCSRINWRTSNLQTHYPTISKEKQTSVFTLYNSSDIDLTLYWDIPTMQLHGHHYIIGVNLGILQNPYQQQHHQTQHSGSKDGGGSSARALFEATHKERTALVNSLTRNLAIKEEGPVKLMTQALDSIQHDFTENG
ncbi:ER-golgi trafficking TRAPP I complex 85 kDa subunit-domain-containing protein [Absidia repens]|uniref:ER-golgi trafficking TRAPP I complex 85 kDa subunit-domain-containing protein n=1 Tax=Absidia repens TaxID=90262 RepID=A0A1X2IFN3_9FUNG|nr:ER-golgi trafficking TRAPP I complex 85 kDa subunit-domain-containing protein [Absidia repens]